MTKLTTIAAPDVEADIRAYELWQRTRDAYGTNELTLVSPVGAS